MSYFNLTKNMRQSTARAAPRGISRLSPGDETSQGRVAYPARVVAKAANGRGAFFKNDNWIIPGVNPRLFYSGLAPALFLRLFKESTR
jgi:hypothetical protein